mmetsp:Transcript_19631/g.30268  ORF Transcript_19631/g.30268 Transcript_19631/m.30268 type:complete len:104 (+) Transcript_19631:472-783(+)
MSNLEESTLSPFGENIVQFDQNTVPFDFDGQRLIWMTYKDDDVRELNIFNFNESKVEMVHRFGKNDGMISHVRFLKTGNPQAPGDTIFYIKVSRFPNSPPRTL